MRVFLTIWISAVLIQEVIPGTLVRLPRHTPKRPALVQTEYEGKYEQKGQNGNENSGLFSGKHQIVHNNCVENWNDFADKCAALVKDLVASLANTVSSRPGDATKLQLQIKNTFKHFDSTHNLTCTDDKAKNSPKLDLSCLFNNITISTVAPTMNNNTNSTVTNNEHEGRKCKNGSELREGVVGPGSNSDGGDGDGCSDGRDNNIGTQYSDPAGVSRKPNTNIDQTTNPDLNPENNGNSDIGINSRRQAEYPQVSWQPGNKTGHSHINQGRSNNISRSPYPFIVTPQPNFAYGSPVPTSYSDDNNAPNGRNGFGSDGQTNSNASPAGASGQSGTPLKTQALPTTNAYQSEPTSDSLYKTGVPATGSHNSAYPTVTGVPAAFNDHHDPTLAPAGLGAHNSENGYTLPKAPVTENSYDPNPVLVKPMTDNLSDSQPGTISSTGPRDPNFSKKNSPESRNWTKEPEFAMSTSTDQTTEYPQSSDPHSLSKNQLNSPVADMIQTVSSATPQDSRLDATSWTPSTKPVLTTAKPDGFNAQKDMKLGVPVINSDSNIPEWSGPESQMGTINPLPTARNPNLPSTASINHEPEYTTFAPTTNKFSGAITPPSDHVPPSVSVEPILPEADSHKSEGPSDPGHILNNPSDQFAPVTVKSSSLSQNFDHLGETSSENMDGKPKRGAPVTVHSTFMPTTISPLGSNTDEKSEGHSGSNGNDNSGKSTTEEDDCEDDDAEDTGTTTATVPQPSGHSLQGTGLPQSSGQEGNSDVKNAIGHSPASGSGSNSNTDPDTEDYEDCDETTDSDSATNARTDNHATTTVVPPMYPVPNISDPTFTGSAPGASGGGNTKSSKDPNSMFHSSSNPGTANDATTPITASPAQSVSHPVVEEVHGKIPDTDDYEDCDEYTESSTGVTTPSNTGTVNGATDPVAVSSVKPATKKPDSAQGSAPVFDYGESLGSSNKPNSMPHSNSNTGIAKDITTPVTAFPIQSNSTVAEPVEHGNIAAPEDYEDCDENTESDNDPTTPIPVSPVKLVPNVLDPTVPVTSSNMGIVNHATSPVPVYPVKPVQSDPAVQGNVPPSDIGGENTGPDSYSSSLSANDSNTPITVSPVPVSPVPVSPVTVSPVPVPSVPVSPVTVSPVPVPSVPVSPVKVLPNTLDPTVQDDVPASDGGGENTGPSSYSSSLSVTSSTTVTPNDANTPVPVSPVQISPVTVSPVPISPVTVSPIRVLPNLLDPTVQDDVPASDGGENAGSSSYSDSVSVTSSSTVTANDPITPVPVSPVTVVPEISDPAVQGDVPASDGAGESAGSSSYPNSASHYTSTTVPSDYPNGVSHDSFNSATANDATPTAESLKPFSTLSDPASQSLQSGGTPTSETTPGVDGDQSGNSQSTPLSVTPSPYLPLGYTTISTTSEGQSQDPETGDTTLYKPTTFQTTAADPTSPQSILIPTQSTGGLTKMPTPSHSSDDDDEDDDDEDCCSCESCTEEITDPKQYKENACRNLEEARKELKAIFDKIKKKLKCGRKPCSHAIVRNPEGKLVMA